MELVVEVYPETQSLPTQEMHGLTSQSRRAAVSLPSNIAEGKGRSSDKELIYFLSNARGSLFEVETQVGIAERLGYISRDAADRLLARAGEVGRLINGLMRAFRSPG